MAESSKEESSKHQLSRRILSTNALPALDALPPPYALEDETHASAQPKDIRYGYRVGDMEIRISSRWKLEWEDVQLSENETYRQTLPASTQVIVDHLKTAIRLGCSLQPMLWPYFPRANETEASLYDKIDALWSLCVAVGAAVCASNIHENEDLTEQLSSSAGEVRDVFDKLEGRVRERNAVDVPNLNAKKKIGEKFTAELEGKYGAVVDALTQYMAHWNFILQVKPLDA